MSETLGETSVLINPSNLKTEPIDRPQSPESNCAICLEEFNNKSYTNSCLHQFCYHCIREWSKIKPECPLCKQRFTKIIYNVRSLAEYDEYYVNTSNIEYDQTVFINFAFPASPVPYFRNALEYRRNPLELRQRMADNMFPNPINNTPSMVYIHGMNNLLPDEEANNFSLSTFEPDLNPHNITLNRYRREIYHRGRWVRPSQSSRVRQSSPEFYRLNPAQTHRLVPWLSRELNVLLDVSIDPQNLVQEILNLITIYHIRSRHFREAMRPHLGGYTEHFVHEFYNYAISPHDIFSYDIMAEYGSQDSRPHRLAREELSDSDSDVEVVNIVPAVGMDLTSQNGPSTSTAGRVFETVIEISDDSVVSDSDDSCQIVGMIKPVTPEKVVNIVPAVRMDLTSQNGPSTSTAGGVFELSDDSVVSDSGDSCQVIGMIKPVTPETIFIESTDEEDIQPKVESVCTIKSESSVTKSSDSGAEQDFDNPQPCSSKSVPSSRFKGGFISAKKIKCSSPSSHSSTASSSTSSSSSSSSLSESSSSPPSPPPNKYKLKSGLKTQQESSGNKSNGTAVNDFDPNRPSSSKFDVSPNYRADRFSTSSKESSSISDSSSLSSPSDSDYSRNRSSSKRKRSKNANIRRERVKRRRRRLRIVSSSSDEEFNPRKIVKRRLKSIVVKPDGKYISSDSVSDSD